MKKINCWEFRQCGRQPGGDKVEELGVCPACGPSQFTGVNGGQNAGRCCWVVAQTLCRGQLQGEYADKMAECLDCPFMLQVIEEEGESFQGAHELLSAGNKREK